MSKNATTMRGGFDRPPVPDGRCPLSGPESVLSNMRAVLLIVLFTLLSGLGDALGFIYAGRVWQGSRFHGVEALKSTAAFQLGVVMYWLALRHLEAKGVVAVEAQTLFWFGATVIGIAVLSRQVVRWPLPDQAVAVVVLIGIGWLLYRTAD